MAFDLSSEAVAFIAIVALTISIVVLVRSIWPRTENAKDTIVILASFAAIGGFVLALFGLFVA